KSVDSDWAFQKFLEEGPVDAFEYFNGAYAFVWHDTDYPDHVFMARNDERPLHFFVDDDSPTILVASELGMLGWMADRCGYRRSKDASKAQFFYLRPDKVYKFSLKEIGKYEEIDRPKYDPTTTLEAPATPPATRIYPTQQVPWYDNDDYDPYDWYGRSRRRYGSHSGGWGRGQRSVLANVKEALAEARNEIHGDGKENSEVVGTEELDERLSGGIKTAIENWEQRRFDAWALCGEYHRIENPNS